MARTTGPLFSNEASGTVGKLMTHSSWKGRSYVRQAVVPTNPDSALQKSVRALLAFLTDEWSNGGISDAQKDTWLPLAATTNIPPMNAYLAHNLQAWTRNRCSSKTYPITDDLNLPSYTGGSPTATAATRSVVIAYTTNAFNDAWGLWIYRDVGGLVLASRNTLVRIVRFAPPGPTSFTDGPLLPGTYSYNFKRSTRTGRDSAPGTNRVVVIT